MKALKGRLSRSSPSKSAKTSTKKPAALSIPDQAIAEARAIANLSPASNKSSLMDNDDDNDDTTAHRSGNAAKNTTTTKFSIASSNKKKVLTTEEQLARAKEQISEEKAGKRKLFHSLVKLANELRRTKNESVPLQEQERYADKNWYEGGMWRSPEVLPGVLQHTTLVQHSTTTRLRQAISLSDLFFNLVIVTAFTRVGVAVSQQSSSALLSDDSISSLLYFAVFWTVWSKEASYSTRFDTTDLSATVETLITCFAVLFGCLSVQAPINTTDGTRIMIMAAFVAALHCFLHIRVAFTNRGSESPLAQHVLKYAMLIVVMTALECSVWCMGIWVFPVDWEYRWALFMCGIFFAFRVPRAFLANDFHAACSKRGVLFILLLGFLLQSIVVVASEFFEYQTPTVEHYSFIGAACLMFFCIKLLYVDDSDTLAEDHALLVNRTAGFFFNVGQFCLLLSTTVMGSGLNLLTHSYLAATAALPDHAKNLVCGGFSAVLLSTFFIKSMHLKRVPTDRRNQALFIAAYVVQSVVLLIVVGVTATMCFGNVEDTFLAVLMQNDIQLLFSLSGAALFVVLMSWLDEGVELALYESAEDANEFRIHPFGFWWCLKADVSEEEMDLDQQSEANNESAGKRLSALSPLLGSSIADMKYEMGYESIPSQEPIV